MYNDNNYFLNFEILGTELDETIDDALDNIAGYCSENELSDIFTE